jgi:hypothetical protein
MQVKEAHLNLSPVPCHWEAIEFDSEDLRCALCSGLVVCGKIATQRECGVADLRNIGRWDFVKVGGKMCV